MIIETETADDWRHTVSRWLIDAGCLYMMAWGRSCSAWDDSVDLANLERFDFNDIPDDQAVMTTWHASETLDEVFCFAHHCAHHDHTELEGPLILDISPKAREDDILNRANAAKG